MNGNKKGKYLINKIKRILNEDEITTKIDLINKLKKKGIDLPYFFKFIAEKKKEINGYNEKYKDKNKKDPSDNELCEKFGLSTKQIVNIYRYSGEDFADTSLELSGSIQNNINKLRRAVNEYKEKNNGRVPSDEYLRKKLNISKQQLNNLKETEKKSNNFLFPIYIDEIKEKKEQNESWSSFEKEILSTNNPEQYAILEETLDKILNLLPEEEREKYLQSKKVKNLLRRGGALEYSFPKKILKKYLNNRNILLVEDSKLWIESFKKKEKKIGLNLIVSENLEDALKKLKDNMTIDLLFLDLKIPKNGSDKDPKDCNGLKILEENSKKKHPVPIIVYSSLLNNYSFDYITNLRKRGLLGYIEKQGVSIETILSYAIILIQFRSKFKEKEKDYKLKNKKLLIIEDEKDWIDFYKRGSKKYGYKLVIARNKEEAEQEIKNIKVNQLKVDLCILDLKFPETNGAEQNIINGFRVLTSLSDINPPIPIVACSKILNSISNKNFRNSIKIRNSIKKLRQCGALIEIDKKSISLKFIEDFLNGFYSVNFAPKDEYILNTKDKKYKLKLNKKESKLIQENGGRIEIKLTAQQIEILKILFYKSFDKSVRYESFSSIQKKNKGKNHLTDSELRSLKKNLKTQIAQINKKIKELVIEITNDRDRGGYFLKYQEKQ